MRWGGVREDGGAFFWGDWYPSQSQKGRCIFFGRWVGGWGVGIPSGLKGGGAFFLVVVGGGLFPTQSERVGGGEGIWPPC